MNALQTEIVKIAKEHFAKAEKHFGYTFPEYDVTFNLKGKTAGTAEWRRVGIHGMSDITLNFNMQLAVDNTENFLKQTVPHEVAHIVAEFLFGSNVKKVNHGKAWKHVMRVFGLEPNRCHQYDVSGVVKEGRYHKAKCNCRTLMLSTTRKNRILQGKASYTCDYCKSKITLC